MKACSAPGPDGLPVVFFERFWGTLRPVIMPMFHEFYIGTLDMGRTSFGVIALIPKVVAASDIRQFRPITIAHPLQSAFPKGMRIHGGILALHEIVHEVASKGLKGVFLKLDFQKAYDRLDWTFLRSGNTAININGEVGPFFQASRGVKQGDPISPLIFNIAVDALAGILDKAKLAGHIQGVVGPLA
ncbi:retrotransposon unclassified [Hordeum vulgare]|nr:retrotransposon unclassified [Hordeum vulgare]